MELVVIFVLNPMDVVPNGECFILMKVDVIQRREQGFSLLELILVVAIVAITGSLAMSFYSDYQKTATRARVISEMSSIQLLIEDYHRQYRHNPASLAVIGIDYQDPWENDYQYYDIEGGGHQTRKDKNLTPINTDYDLYSMGPDGRSALPLTAKFSRDDIIRANNGSYLGDASEY